MNTEVPVVPSPEIHDDGSHDDRITAAANAHVNVNRIELGGTTLTAIVALAILTGINGVVIGLDVSERASEGRQVAELTQAYKDLKTQNWLLERRLMDKEALDIIHGRKLPSDTEFGPTGNMQRMKPEK